MPPPAQRPATQRAAQLPARQLPLDQCPVTVYREHDASKRQPSGPPRGHRQKDNGKGRPPTGPPPRPAPPPGMHPRNPPPRGQGAAANKKPVSRPPATP